jgi:hypothetical protein
MGEGRKTQQKVGLLYFFLFYAFTFPNYDAAQPSTFNMLTVSFLFLEHHMNLILSAYQLDTLHCGFDDTVSSCNKK